MNFHSPQELTCRGISTGTMGNVVFRSSFLIQLSLRVNYNKIYMH